MLCYKVEGADVQGWGDASGNRGKQPRHLQRCRDAGGSALQERHKLCAQLQEGELYCLKPQCGGVRGVLQCGWRTPTDVLLLFLFILHNVSSISNCCEF